MSRRALFVLAAGAGLISAGCDTNPTDAEPADSEVAAQSVQEVWSLLPSTMEVEEAAFRDLDAGGASEATVALMLDAGEIAADVEEAEAAGELDAVERLEATVDSLATQALLTTMSDVDAEAFVSGVETALASLDAGLARSADPEVRARLTEAARALTLARSARARAHWAVAVRHAARAADELRWLDPERKAKAAVAAAHRMLERAALLAGDDPEPPIARALAAADTLCAAATVALEGERWRLAIGNARGCARIARAVIVRLGGVIDPDVLAERAKEAVAHAGAVLERVTAEAGEDPGSRVEALLADAGVALERAQVALDEERYRVAIGLSATSTALSLRALRLIRDDIPDPYELRATAAVETARALSARVSEKIDDTTPPEIVEAATRADGLLADAEEAFEAGEWYRAWSLARGAVTVYVRILVVLA